jgi:hypothetical protein
MAEAILQFVVEVIGEVVLAGLLILALCAFGCVLATPFILIGAARDRAPFWHSLPRRYFDVVRAVAKLADRLPL